MNKMAQLNITLDTELLHGLFTKDNRDDAFSKLLEVILNQVLIAQSTEQLGADPYERSEDRTAYRNGFRDRELPQGLELLHCAFQDTEMETLALPCSNDIREVNKLWFLP